MSDTRLLTISARPNTFDELTGMVGLVKQVREHIASGRMPPAWCFIGESGIGKTTVARILSLSLQCEHQTGEFGNPCADCIRERRKYDIYEINSAEHSGVEEVERIVVGAYNWPKPPSKYRIYIWDECQKLSPSAQQCLLKYFEESPESTVWIVCTTEPSKILRTLRRRCLTFTLPGLSVDGVQALVVKTLERGKSNKDAGELADALLEASVRSPGFIVLACERYMAGLVAKKAALVGLDATVDTLAICRATVRGDWKSVCKLMYSATSDDARVIRASVAGYLKKVILLNPDGSSVSKAAVEGILDLMKFTYIDDGVQLPGTVATLCKICARFRV